MEVSKGEISKMFETLWREEQVQGQVQFLTMDLDLILNLPLYSPQKAFPTLSDQECIIAHSQKIPEGF